VFKTPPINGGVLFSIKKGAHCGAAGRNESAGSRVGSDGVKLSELDEGLSIDHHDIATFDEDERALDGALDRSRTADREGLRNGFGVSDGDALEIQHASGDTDDETCVHISPY
jgi:hypothetical protein